MSASTAGFVFLLFSRSEHLIRNSSCLRTQISPRIFIWPSNISARSNYNACSAVDIYGNNALLFAHHLPHVAEILLTPGFLPIVFFCLWRVSLELFALAIRSLLALLMHQAKIEAAFETISVEAISLLNKVRVWYRRSL